MKSTAEEFHAREEREAEERREQEEKRKEERRKAEEKVKEEEKRKEREEEKRKEKEEEKRKEKEEEKRKEKEEEEEKRRLKSEFEYLEHFVCYLSELQDDDAAVFKQEQMEDQINVIFSLSHNHSPYHLCNHRLQEIVLQVDDGKHILMVNFNKSKLTPDLKLVE